MSQPIARADVHEFDMAIHFSNDQADEAGAAAIHALTSLNRRPSEVTCVSPMIGRGRYVALITNRRGTDPLRAIQDTVHEMRAVGLDITGLGGVGRRGTDSMPYLGLDDVTEKANAWLAENNEHQSSPSATITFSDIETRRLPRQERLDYLLSVLNRVGCDDPRPRYDHDHDACATTPTGLAAAPLARTAHRARAEPIPRTDLLAMRRTLLALNFAHHNRVWPEGWEVTERQLNNIRTFHAVGFVHRWEQPKTPKGRFNAVMAVLQRTRPEPSELNPDARMWIEPEQAVFSLADLLDATVDLDQQPTPQ